MERLEKAAGKQFEFDNCFFFNPRKMGSVNLYQIGELSCEAGFRIDSHVQMCHEISLIISGRGKFITDDKETEVQAGDIYAVAKGHIHAIQTDRDESLRYLYLGFDFNDYANEENAVLDNFFIHLYNPVAKDKNGILSLFTQAVNEFYNNGEFSSYMRSSYVKQIIILTYRNFVESKGSPVYLRMDSHDSVGFTAYRIVRYIEEHVCEIKSIRDIADQLNYSYGYLSHVFKEKTGISLMDYIGIRKMREAVGLLEEGRLNITQISEKLNFKTVQSFSKAFKRLTGISPFHYIKSRANETRSHSTGKGE